MQQASKDHHFHPLTVGTAYQMMVLIEAPCPMSSSSAQKGRFTARLTADIDALEMLFLQMILSLEECC